MKIVVLIKQVPDTAEVTLDRKTGNLIREGVESIVNPDDRQALGLALQLKDDYQATITDLSMGPPQAVDVLSEALGMGCDEAVLLTDRAFAGADTWATSTTLGKALEKIGNFDLVLCGYQAIDGDTAQTGPQIAEYLNLPQACYINNIEKVEGDKIIVTRCRDDVRERLAISLPALLTVSHITVSPRYPAMSNLINACSEKAPIKIWNAADIGALNHEMGMEGSLTQVIKTFSPKTSRAGEILEGDVPEVVNSLLGKMREVHLI
ncbi:MAG: electron transfer flavoprotein subunit beta/FixA family protein [Deltaproteobacteria bacterium]|nr:electron transfer flavoprotein subunit beta/FixA family protein [Deltaproteobacteria bacterium]